MKIEREGKGRTERTKLPVPHQRANERGESGLVEKKTQGPVTQPPKKRKSKDKKTSLRWSRKKPNNRRKGKNRKSITSEKRGGKEGEVELLDTKRLKQKR